MTTQFVILHHVLHDGEHWDLMLETEPGCERLLTWQLPAEPTGLGAFPIAARPIGDHRRAYLTYEGPVSGDRGHVRRVDAGQVEWLASGTGRHELRLKGRRLRGRFILSQTSESLWTMTTAAEAGA